MPTYHHHVNQHAFTTLTSDEARVLGVLIEKAQTTPAQYPLSLNAIATGASQKNNRDPVQEYDEDRAYEAVDSLRKKGYAREVDLAGSRVNKYRHVAREALDIGTPALVVLAELLLRGPQTSGELRTRASRMHPLESVDVVEAVLSAMASQEHPLVRKIPHAPGGRAPRWEQLLAPSIHPTDTQATSTPPQHHTSHSSPAKASHPTAPSANTAVRLDQLEQLVADLTRRVAALEQSSPPERQADITQFD